MLRYIQAVSELAMKWNVYFGIGGQEESCYTECEILHGIGGAPGGNKFGINQDVEDGVLTGEKYFHREIDVGNM